jgi:hypothetical protein
MFWEKPLYIANVIITVKTNRTGKAKNKSNENHQPLKKAKKRPETDMARES